MRRTRHVVLPVRSWQYTGLMIVSLACLTLGLVSRDREGRSGSLAGPELKHTAPHEMDACPNVDPFAARLLPPRDEITSQKGQSDEKLGTWDPCSPTSGLSKSTNVKERESRTWMSSDRKNSNVRDDPSNRRTRSFQLKTRISKRQSINADRRARIIGAPLRDYDFVRERLISRSKARKLIEEESARSRSYERKSTAAAAVYDGAHRNYRRNNDLVRSVRLVPISRLNPLYPPSTDISSRSRIDGSRRNVRRMDLHKTERPHSTEQRDINSMLRLRSRRVVALQSESPVRENIVTRRSTLRSQQRGSSERRRTIEGDENVIRSRNVGIYRSPPTPNVDSRREGRVRRTNPIDPQERRMDIFQSSRKSDIIRRVGERNVPTRSRDLRLSQSRNLAGENSREEGLRHRYRTEGNKSRRVDVPRVEERKSSQRREINEHLERHIDVNRLDVRRMEITNHLATARARGGGRSLSRLDLDSRVRQNKRTSWMDSLRRSERRRFSQERCGRFLERRMSTREDPKSRESDREQDVRRKSTAIVSVVPRIYRMEKYPHVRDEPHRINLIDIPKIQELEDMPKTEIYDYLRQALILLLCAVYGASLLNGKGASSYCFRNIFTQTSRLLVAS